MFVFDGGRRIVGIEPKKEKNKNNEQCEGWVVCECSVHRHTAIDNNDNNSSAIFSHMDLVKNRPQNKAQRFGTFEGKLQNLSLFSV